MIKEADKQKASNLMEGMVSFRAVLSGIQAGISDRKIEKVLVDETRVRAITGHLSYIKAMSYQYGFSIEMVKKEKIDELAVGDSHGGILTVCTDRRIPELSEIKLSGKGIWFFLDGIEDPYNFGYALRSLYASGAEGVLLPRRNWMQAAGVVCRASAGASEQMQLALCPTENSLEIFRETGYKILCADLKNSTSMWAYDLTAPLLLVIGGEKRGISKEILAQADGIVRIDYGREFSAALSAASAATVLSFEILRQNQKKNQN
jgi:23S rRNA (guanosine2251-2'-O)-methyltransferase